MNPFGQGFPEPLQSVVHHAERFSAAVGLAETDQRRAVATGPRELTLSETWLVGRAGEVESVVEDVAREWRVGVLSAKGAAAAIEFYLRALHRGMRDTAGLAGPTCCASAHECLTADFSTPRDLLAMSYPGEAPAVRLPPVAPPPMVVRMTEAKSSEAKVGLSRVARTIEIRL
jgi:hypothetical protein